MVATVLQLEFPSALFSIMNDLLFISCDVDHSTLTPLPFWRAVTFINSTGSGLPPGQNENFKSSMAKSFPQPPTVPSDKTILILVVETVVGKVNVEPSDTQVGVTVCATGDAEYGDPVRGSQVLACER